MANTGTIAPSNILLTVTNTAALSSFAFAVSQPRFYALAPLIGLSAIASSLYHWTECGYRGHPHMQGRPVLGWIRQRRRDQGTAGTGAGQDLVEEKTLLAVDRALSLVLAGSVVGVCGPAAVWRVISGPQTAWVVPLALLCAICGEIRAVKGALLGHGLFSGYAVMHSLWHVLVYQVPLLCMLAEN
ncbi:hypothetical protein HDU82_005847 [Entophlyctis luteolus]|nr:hypothetical protein HDU82_005847 [Entophlyctis luteolus]